MCLNNIIYLVKDYLILGIIVTMFLTLIIFFGYNLIYKKFMKGKKKISFQKLAVAAILLCYLFVVIGVTLASRLNSYQVNINLHPFTAYKEAWNRFSATLWRNIILNILMFVPIGFLLPILSNKFKKPWRTYLIGFLLTLGIELIQYYTGRGIFEIDDITGNTVGTMIGYGLITFLIYVIEKLRNKTSSIVGKKVVVYQTPLISIIILFSSIFLIYSKQELGNLTINYDYKYNMSDVFVKSHISLSDLEKKAYVYKSKVGTKDETFQIANNILKEVNTKVDEKQNNYLDETVLYKSVSGNYTVWINYTGLTVSFNDSSQKEKELQEGYTLDKVMSILENYNIVFPEKINFEEEGDGNYLLTAKMEEFNDGFIDGTFSCTITKDGMLSSYNNALIQYKTYKEYDVISEQEAFENLKEGKVNHMWLYEKPKSIDVQKVKLDYQLDSKGYYQPIYIFEVFFNGDKGEKMEIPIMALKN